MGSQFLFLFHHDFKDEVAYSVPNSIMYVVVVSLHGDWRHGMPTAVARYKDETGGGGEGTGRNGEERETHWHYAAAVTQMSVASSPHARAPMHFAGVRTPITN